MTAISESIIDAETADGVMGISVKQPAEGGPYPTIVLFMDAPGIRASILDFSERLAAEGYRVVAPDLYHRHDYMFGLMPEERSGENASRMGAMFQSLTDEGIQQDLDDALSAVGVGADEKLGTIGFCLGARAVYRTLMRLPDQFVAGVAWHPSLLVDDGDDSPHLTAAQLKQPLYLGVGAEDTVQSVELLQPFYDVVAPMANVEVEIFEGADHAFTWPAEPNYHEAAATGSWAKTTALFRDHLSS